MPLYETLDQANEYDNLDFGEMNSCNYEDVDLESNFTTVSSASSLNTLVDASTLNKKVNKERARVTPPNRWMTYIAGALTALWFLLKHC